MAIAAELKIPGDKSDSWEHPRVQGVPPYKPTLNSISVIETLLTGWDYRFQLTILHDYIYRLPVIPYATSFLSEGHCYVNGEWLEHFFLFPCLLLPKTSLLLMVDITRCSAKEEAARRRNPCIERKRLSVKRENLKFF